MAAGRPLTRKRRFWRIIALGERQQGVVGYRQLVALGFTRSEIRQLVAEGWLHPVHHGVYAIGRPTLTRKGHWMAAVLSCGPTAVLSHYNAAALWGVRDTNQRKIDVTVPHARRAIRPRVRVHYTQCLHPEDVTVEDGIPVTSVARTVFDLAAGLRRPPLTKVIEEADRRELFDLIALDRAIARTPRRQGAKRLHEVLATYRPPPDTRSNNERRLFEAMLAAGLPEPLVNTIVAGYEVDFFWPEFQLVVELDSPAYHGSPRMFESDRAKDAVLQRAGCAVLRVTEARVEDDLSGVLDDITALARRRRAA